MNKNFQALLLEQQNGKVSASIQQIDEQQLPEGDVTIAVEYSSLNYKDGMVLQGIGRLVRSYPHVPGIDLAGRVIHSQSPDYQVGDHVILTGWRVGEVHWGGYAERARVRSEWLVPLPDGLDCRTAMSLGTAGVAAMLAILALEDYGLRPGAGEVLVTGGAGGVGSIAIAYLSALGYPVVTSSGRPEAEDYLRALGATRILPRAELALPLERPLESEIWAGCVDAVGGNTLARILAETALHGAVASVGLAGGNQLGSSLLPFLLRGVGLLGIDSTTCPQTRRLQVWKRLAQSLPKAQLEAITREVALDDLPQLGKEILAGRVRGRVVVNVGG